MANIFNLDYTAKEINERLSKIQEIDKSNIVNGEGENSLQTTNSRAVSINTVATGSGTIAGGRGFTITAVADNGDGTGTYTLSSVTGIEVGMQYSAALKTANYNAGTVTAIDGNIVTVDGYVHKELNTNIDDLDNYKAYNVFMITGRPDLGDKEIGFNASAQGERSYAQNSSSHAEGYQTRAIGQYSHTEGYETVAGHNGHAEGGFSQALGDSSHAEGARTKALGRHGHAEGDDSIASGTDSHAEGYSTKAEGNQSHSEGHWTRATKNYAHAEGDHSYAEGVSSHAEGKSTIAKGTNSHAEGEEATASGLNTHAEGYQTKAAGSYAHAEGNGTLAEYAAHAEGSFTEAKGSSAHAEGARTYATGNHAHAEGNETEAIGVDAHAEGYSTKAEGNQSHAEGNGSEAIGIESHAEGHWTSATGDYSHAEGMNANALGQSAHAEGRGTKATSENSHAEGYQTEATGLNSHTEGETTKAGGAAAHAEGSLTEATGDYSHAEGKGSRAVGQYSHTEGSDTVALGDSAHAEGLTSRAEGNQSHAEGSGTLSTGENSHTEGRWTKASGMDSHAENRSAEAIGEHSHAGGWASKSNSTGSFVHGNRVTADANYQAVFGENNEVNTNAAFIVGNGNYDKGLKSNAFEVMKSGDTYIKGQLFIGNTGSVQGSAKQVATTDNINTINNRLAMVEDIITAGSGNFVTDSEIACTKIVPDNVASYAALNKLGGLGILQNKEDGSYSYPPKVKTIDVYGGNLLDYGEPRHIYDSSSTHEYDMTIQPNNVLHVEKITMSDVPKNQSITVPCFNLNSNIVYPAGAYSAVDPQGITEEISNEYITGWLWITGKTLSGNRIVITEEFPTLISEPFTLDKVELFFSIYSNKGNIRITDFNIKLFFCKIPEDYLNDYSNIPNFPRKHSVLAIPEEITSRDDYGLGVYTKTGTAKLYNNYIDFERKKYVKNCLSVDLDGVETRLPLNNSKININIANDTLLCSDSNVTVTMTRAYEQQDQPVSSTTQYIMCTANVNGLDSAAADEYIQRMKNDGTPVKIFFGTDFTEEIDISEILRGFDNYLPVEVGDLISFTNESTAPVVSEIEYQQN